MSIENLPKLNKQERDFIKETNINADGEIKDILFYRRVKKFQRELNKLTRQYVGEDDINIKRDLNNNICHILSYKGEYNFEVLEEYIYCFKDDLKAGAKRYFETYY